jgi:hypothetical protein
MTKAIVLYNFSPNKFKDALLSVKAIQIQAKMVNNIYFPSPNPALDRMIKANKAYSASLSKIKNGNKEDTLLKNSARTALEKSLRELAANVQSVSGGDEAIIVSSGFDIRKAPSPVGPLEKPTNVKVTMGVNKGSVVVSCNRIVNAKTYIVYYTEFPLTPNRVWNHEIGTKCKVPVINLISGSKMIFCIAAIGTNPTLTWSDEITTYIL